MKIQNRQKLIAVVGPTASGKTALARRLAREFGGFIISADSRQVYRYMDIGTGKVETREELKELQRQRSELLQYGVSSPIDYCVVWDEAPHYMVDFVDPRDEYNVARYQKDVLGIISSKCKVLARLRTRSGTSGQSAKLQLKVQSYTFPILAGGTGLYIDAVADNWRFPKGEPNYEMRAVIERRIEEEGIEAVWRELIVRDPGCARFVQKENPRRVARALEYVLSAGKKFSEARGKGERRFDVLKIGLTLPREELYKKIDARVEARLKRGMIEEVEELHRAHGLSFERLRQFGLEYRLIAEYVESGKENVAEMTQRLKWNSHDYARRQLTWFRRDKEIQWVTGYEEAIGLVRVFLGR